ncbi:hypothetical protein AURDEDRAFT_124780 [Auricularia subglabra TFB-10046 SS5]|nr:hypothetical protein AURDEDRAFT_124780 [Auricularia subglabra TFB-10046 SS5]
MSSATVRDRAIPWSKNAGKDSKLFTLHRPDLINFEDALQLDMILRGISVSGAIQLPDLPGRKEDDGSQDVSHVAVTTEPSTLSATPTGTVPPEVFAVPPIIATGGAFSPAGTESPLGGTRASTPLLAHSASSSSRKAFITTGVEPDDMLAHQDRVMTLGALNFNDGLKYLPYAGYSLKMERD